MSASVAKLSCLLAAISIQDFGSGLLGPYTKFAAFFAMKAGVSKIPVRRSSWSFQILQGLRFFRLACCSAFHAVDMAILFVEAFSLTIYWRKSWCCGTTPTIGVPVLHASDLDWSGAYKGKRPNPEDLINAPVRIPIDAGRIAAAAEMCMASLNLQCRNSTCVFSQNEKTAAGRLQCYYCSLESFPFGRMCAVRAVFRFQPDRAKFKMVVVCAQCTPPINWGGPSILEPSWLPRIPVLHSSRKEMES